MLRHFKDLESKSRLGFGKKCKYAFKERWVLEAYLPQSSSTRQRRHNRGGNLEALKILDYSNLI